MRNCFHHINRQARDYLRREMEDNDEKAVDGVYGGDVPDELCYQWAEEYFRDPDAEVDRPKEGRQSETGSQDRGKKRARRGSSKKQRRKSLPRNRRTMEGQITFGDLAGGKAVAVMKLDKRACPKSGGQAALPARRAWAVGCGNKSTI